MKNGRIIVGNRKLVSLIDYIYFFFYLQSSRLGVPWHLKCLQCHKTTILSTFRALHHLKARPSITIDLFSPHLAPGIIFLLYYLPVNSTALCPSSQCHHTVFILSVWFLPLSIISRFTCFIAGMTNKNPPFLRPNDIPLLSTEYYLAVASLVGISVVSALSPWWP